MLACPNDFHISLFLVELILREGHFSHNKHIQLNTSTYIKSVFQTYLGTYINGFVKLNENENFVGLSKTFPNSSILVL